MRVVKKIFAQMNCEHENNRVIIYAASCKTNKHYGVTHNVTVIGIVNRIALGIMLDGDGFVFRCLYICLF